MKRYKLKKREFDLTDQKNYFYLQEKYKNYFTQRIEGHPCCMSYFGENLIFCKKVANRMLIVSVDAPSNSIRDYWRTFPLQKLLRKVFDLFYNRKYILL